MYSRNVQFSILQSKYNLKNIILCCKLVSTNTNINVLKSMKYYKMFRQIKISDSCRNILDIHKALFENSVILRSLRSNILSMPHNLKNESSNLLRVWTHQCECVVAQRVRRGQQMFFLYSRLWEEHALKEFFKNIRQQVSKRGKDVMFSAIGISVYNWDKYRIGDAEIESHLYEMDYIFLLRDKTTKCDVCSLKEDKQKVVDKSIISFCDCKARRNNVRAYENWSLFIEQPELIVWRRLHTSGAYEYKVYGTYGDVSAEDFLNVQIDTVYRKIWDASAVVLEAVECDPTDISSNIIYWEMQWPRLFANRDYVFNRRYLVTGKTIIILSKGTSHPQFPAKSNKYRVEDYWSSMVIKPYTEIGKPGIEFSLTYFDNPGVNIPAAVTTWVAYRAMPDFLTRLRAAAKEYKKYCTSNNCRGAWCSKNAPEPANVIRDETKQDDDKKKILDILLPEEKKHSSHRSKSDNTPIHTSSNALVTTTLTEADIILSPSPIEEHDQNYWKYLQPNYYLG